MSNTKHTPGPWTVTTGKHTETTDLYDKGDTWFNVNGEDGIIADVCFGRCLGNDEEDALANAKLIAAAPEMLEVMTTLYVTMKNNGFNGGHWKKHLDQMNAVIKKATE